MTNSDNSNNGETPGHPSSSPSANKMVVPIQHPGTLHISLIDQSDKLIYETTIEVQNQEFMLDLSHLKLAPGEYRVEITSDKESHLLKMIKS